jgi:hypothetical protein
MARWGTPSPVFALKGHNFDLRVTNVRNVASPHWRRWLDVESRCVVPFTSFSENQALPDGLHPPVWFALGEDRPLAFFAGIWTRWTRIVREVMPEGDISGGAGAPRAGFVGGGSAGAGISGAGVCQGNSPVAGAPFGLTLKCRRRDEKKGRQERCGSSGRPKVGWPRRPWGTEVAANQSLSAAHRG